MRIRETAAVKVTVDAPANRLSEDLANPATHPEWATEFFGGPAVNNGDGTWTMNVARMGGDAVMKIESEPTLGVIDLYLSPVGAPFGPPLPIRVVPNGEGADVLFTLSRFPDQSDEDWEQGIRSMERELENFRRRHEEG